MVVTLGDSVLVNAFLYGVSRVSLVWGFVVVSGLLGIMVTVSRSRGIVYLRIL